MIEYLMSWGRLDTVEIQDFDGCGTLSHLLILHLALFEEEMRACDKRLPIWKPREKPDLKETDAERQIAFSQEQRRKKANGGEQRTSAENIENKDDRPDSRVRSVNLSEKSQRLGESPKISVSRLTKRDRSYRDQRKHESGVSKESKRRGLTEPRSRSDTGRGRRQIREHR